MLHTRRCKTELCSGFFASIPRLFVVDESTNKSHKRPHRLSQSLVAIDGSKFKAVNNRDRNFTQVARPDGAD